MTLERFWSGGLRAWPVAAAAGAGALALYVATLSPLVGADDPAEFQALAGSGGIAHSGYPTFVLLLQAFGALPLGTLAWRANLLTACFGAAAVALLAYAAYRWTGRAAASLGAAAVFALAITSWKEATLAGVHAPTLAVDAALLLLALRYAWRPGPGLALAGGLLFGLGLTAHLTVLALAPVLALALLRGAPHARSVRRHVAAAALGVVVGLSPFAYVIAVDRPEQPMNYIHDTLEPGQYAFAVERPDLRQRLQRLGWLLSGEQYLGATRRDAWALAHRAFHSVSVLLLNDLPFAVFPVALAGLALVLARGGPLREFVLAWFVPALVLAAVGGTELTLHYFIQPCTWLLALALAVALAWLAGRDARLGWAGLAVVLAMPLLRHALPESPGPLARVPKWARVWAMSPADWSPFRVDRRHDDYGRGVMARLPADAVVLAGSWEVCGPLRYFVHGEPLRPQVRVLYAGKGAVRFARMAREAEAAGRPVFFTHAPEPAALAGARTELVWDSGWRQLHRFEGSAAAPRPPSR